MYLCRYHNLQATNAVSQMLRSLFILCLVALSVSSLLAQVPFGPAKTPPAGEILLNLKKLNVVGSVLYIAAHPDDENTLLLAYMAKDRLVRTAYLSLTRGDGGQNLIGPEQGEYIGLIRTQELLAARRVDGPEQFFSRAYDFGFSKSTDEAVRTWGQDQVLADVVWRIRTFQPDVIITRFPPDGRAGHGHHSASGFLAEEAFKIANDPTKFPEQLAYAKPWQPKRILWNVFIPSAFMSNRKPDEAGNLVGIETGVYNPLLGKSYGEVAAESRSQHKSQGFGVSANRGARIDYLLTKNGDPMQQDPFDGVDVTWKRIKNSEGVQTLVNQIIAQYKPDRPATSVPALVQLYKAINQLDTNNINVRAKRQEVDGLIQQCLGLWFESNPTDFAAAPGERIRVNTTVVGRTSEVPVRLISVRYPVMGRDTILNLTLKANEVVPLPTSLMIPANQPISQPYWLEKPLVKGMFQVSDQRLVGLPENPAALTTQFTFDIAGQNFTFTRPWVFKSVDPVDGEIYRPFVVQPDVMINIAEKVYAFADNAPKTVEAVVKAGRAGASGNLSLSVPTGWQVSPAQAPFELKDKGQEQRLTFTVTPSGKASNGQLQAVATTSTGQFSRGIRLVEYKHIPTQTNFPTSEAKLVRLDVKTAAKQIGYIMGAGDEVPLALRQMGCTVTMLNQAELDKDLSRFDAIMVGVRAYNTEDHLKFYQAKLMQYVQNGGTMIVQYMTAGGSGFLANGLKVNQIGPYPFNIGRDRITEEDAPVTFVNPQHPLLNKPNKLTDTDFSGWVQERGIYFAVDYDKAYEPIFSMNDTGEATKNGSLIYAKYGKGHFMYTGLVFFRELPAGVPGAYRLLANMISVGK